ncbi:MAG: FmdB family zinc ribbon protein [Actinomycetota bacterium]
MPTYEYECTSCGQHIEVFQRFSEDALETCGVCGGPLRKVFHPAGIVFKGSGFYATDSRAKSGSSQKKDTGSSGDSSSSSSSSSGSSSSSSTDSSSSSSDGKKEKKTSPSKEGS